MSRILLSIWLVWLVGTLLLKAQAPELHFSRLPMSKSLTSQYVTGMVQDHYGYLWIGTQDGINRYDGHEIRFYRSFNRNRLDGLVGSMVEHMVVDGRNQLWVATSHGLSLYNWQYDYFEVVVSDQDLKGLPGVYLEFLSLTPEGHLLAGFSDQIFRYNQDKQQFEWVLSSPLGALSSFLIDEQGAWWLGHHAGQGILCYPDPADSSSFVYYQQQLVGEKADYKVLDLAAANGYIWAALENGGVARISKDEQEVKRYFEQGGERYFFGLETDVQGRLWTSDYSGLKLYLPESDAFDGYYHMPLEAGSLATGLNGSFVDRQGNLYSYHNGEGVYVSYRQRGFRTYNALERNYWHTTGANISAIHEDQEGNLWLGNFKGGLDVFLWKEGRTLRIASEDGPVGSALGPGSVLALYSDRKGRMWVGTHAGGLHRYNESGEDFEVWRKGLTVAAPSFNDLRSITEDDKGMLWLGLHGGGVDRFDPETETFENYNERNNGLSSDWVYKVLVDRWGNLWVATVHGLNVLRPGSDRFEVFLANPDVEGGLRGNQIITLLEDEKGRLWVGTNNGLFTWEGEGRFKRYGEDMVSQFVTAIEQDAAGKIWVATLHGLYALHPEENLLHSFDEVDGLQGPGFNINASFSNGVDYLLFGGPKGVNHFNPNQLSYNMEPPVLRFSRFSLFNVPVTSYGEDQLLPAELNTLDEIVLNYDQKFFSIEFVGLNFFNPAKNTYACMLEGFDETWIDLGNKRSASYTNLYPGTYVFRVKAANNDGVWTEEGIAVKIKVLPPWWMTWWALLLFVSLVLLLIWGVFVFRTRQLRKQKVKLETTVADQTIRLRLQNKSLQHRAEELEQANRLLEERRELIGEQASKLEEQAEELQASNEQLVKHLQTKDRLYSLVAHDLRAPFNTIMGFASLLTDAGDDADKEKVKMYARFINDAALQVFNLLENLLFWARSQSDEIQFSPSALNLSDLIRETLDLLSDSALKKTVAMYEQVDTDVQVYADENMLRTIVRNLLMNALKFTDAGGEVRVAAKKSGEQIRICVIDSGVGMDAATLEKISSAQGHTESGTRGEKGSGLGLLLCRDFIERNGGQLEVSSTPGKGSRFCFTLPLAD